MIVAQIVGSLIGYGIAYGVYLYMTNKREREHQKRMKAIFDEYGMKW